MRFAVELEAQIRPVNHPDGALLAVRTKDISSSGAFFKTDAGLKLGQSLHLILDIRNKIQNINRMKGVGHVVRIEPDGVAVSFSEGLALVAA